MADRQPIPSPPPQTTGLTPWQRAVIRAKIAVYSRLPGERFERKVSRRMLLLRDVDWPAVKAEFDTRLASLDENAVCLDLGANIGDMTRQMAETGATVHAFEPDPSTFAILEKAVGHYPNVVLHNAAVGAADGELVLQRHPDFDTDPVRYSEGTTAYRSTFNGTTGEKIVVPMIGLRGFLDRLGRSVNLIKMDIEGSEVEVLEDLLGSPALQGVDAMFVETHEAQMPELRQRLAAIRAKVKSVQSPRICLDWK